VIIAALEGSSYAGKSTAIALLWSALPAGTVVFDCYVQQIRRAADIPPARTRNAAEQLAAFEAFMGIEADRVEHLADLADDQRPGLVIADRSVDTLLAHAHALDQLYGFGVCEQATDRLKDLPHLVPDRTLYLDADPDTVRLRRQRQGGRGDYFLHDRGFLAHTRDYFLGPARSPISRQVIPVAAGTGPADQIAQEIGSLLGPVLR
jgi:dTMP kinase